MRIWIQHFRPMRLRIRMPDLMSKKCNILELKKIPSFWYKKLKSIHPQATSKLQEKPPADKREQYILHFLLLFWSISPTWIRIRVFNAKTDPAVQNRCECMRIWIWIRIHNTALCNASKIFSGHRADAVHRGLAKFRHSFPA